MKTHKYNIGDKVKILLANEDANLIGKVRPITKIEDGCYCVRGSRGAWGFEYAKEAFELVSPKAKSMQNNPNLCKPMQDEVEITKKSVDYTLNMGKYKIFATVSDKGITLKTYNDCEDFVFIESEPEMLKNIASLMLEASKLK